MNSLKAGYINLSVHTFPDFLGVGAFQEELYRFLQVCGSLLDGISLAGHIQFRAKRNIPRSLSFHQSG
jgi:hypothetical protein